MECLRLFKAAKFGSLKMHVYVCTCMYDWFVPFGNSTKGSLDRITSSWHNTTHNTNVLRLACIFVISHILADFSRRSHFCCPASVAQVKESGLELSTLGLRVCCSNHCATRPLQSWEKYYFSKQNISSRPNDWYAQKLKIEGSLRDNFLWPHIQA